MPGNTACFLQVGAKNQRKALSRNLTSLKRDPLGLLRQQPLCLRPMPFALAILFKRILDVDRFVREVLPLHRFDCRIRSIEIVVGDESVAFGFAGGCVSCDL